MHEVPQPPKLTNADICQLLAMGGFLLFISIGTAWLCGIFPALLMFVGLPTLVLLWMARDQRRRGL
jgi:hypothetical protein